MVFWQQDVYSRAIAVSAENRLGFTGRLIGRAADRVERDIARRSAGVIPITDAFMPTLRRWKVDDARIATIPNWAPIDEMPCLPRRNAWSMDHDLDGRHVLLYSGTLGLKHDPSILLRIARLLHAEDPEARLMVVSEGAGRSWLEEHKGPDLPQLVLADYQPYDVLPEVLASADILIAILEPAAGVFSVPSKILSYMCAGRPTLAVMPPSNLAAKIISRVSAGIVVEPGDLNGIDTAVRKLRADEVRRDEMGFNARSYAEATFDITQIAQCFEARLAAAAGLARSAGCQ